MQQLDEHCQAALDYGGQLGVGVGCLGEGQGPPGLAGSAGALTGLIHLSPYMPYGSLTAVTVTLCLLPNAISSELPGAICRVGRGGGSADCAWLLTSLLLLQCMALDNHCATIGQVCLLAQHDARFLKHATASE